VMCAERRDNKRDTRKVGILVSVVKRGGCWNQLGQDREGKGGGADE